jgi:thiamine pyrophosphate-dependent acetolactate synthase large subunit-like protein
MIAKEAVRVLAAHRGDAIAVCALGVAANEWWDATKAEDSFQMHGAMGFAASFGLGLALSLPNVKIWIINSDGSLCMNPGCLLTEAAQAPHNLKHFVIDNQVYQTVGAMPMVNAGRTDYAGLARASGITNAYTIDNVAEMEKQLPRLIAEPGPTFVVLRVEPDPSHINTPPITYEGPEMKYRFGRALEKRLGISVFNSSGY